MIGFKFDSLLLAYYYDKNLSNKPLFILTLKCLSFFTCTSTSVNTRKLNGNLNKSVMINERFPSQANMFRWNRNYFKEIPKMRTYRIISNMCI